jgi:uncharacterized protein YjbI with pentapeptide repeats
MEIKNIYGEVIYTSNKETIKESVEEAVKNKVSLYKADLFGANLEGANLYGAKIDSDVDIRKLLKIK